MKRGRVTATECCVYLGISATTFGKLCVEGVIERQSPSDGYDLKVVVRSCCGYWRRLASGRAAEPGQERVLSEARARATTAQAEERELRLAVMRGSYVSARAVVLVLGDYISGCRERLLSLSGMAATLVGCDFEEISAALVDAIDEALSDLAAAKISADIIAHDEGRPRHDRRQRSGSHVAAEDHSGDRVLGLGGNEGGDVFGTGDMAHGVATTPRSDQRRDHGVLLSHAGGVALSQR
jgi:hypothetical protein